MNLFSGPLSPTNRKHLYRRPDCLYSGNIRKAICFGEKEECGMTKSEVYFYQKALASVLYTEDRIC